MEWLVGAGAIVWVPVVSAPDYDLIAEFGDRLVRVQVKTSTCWRENRWQVTLATRGGNRSWSGLVKRLDAARCDCLFVHVGDGRRWYIPTWALDARSGLVLGGPKYSRYEVERGQPLRARPPPAVEPAESTSQR